MSIERKRIRNEIGEIASLVLFSFTLPQEIVYDLDAVCVFTGQGERVRLIQPVKKYWENKNTKNKFFLIAGHNKNEKTFESLTLDTVTKYPYNIKRIDGLHIETNFVHTKNQADWTIEKIKELSIKSCAIVATPFHLPRAYLTTLASMFSNNIMIPIIPVPTMTSPNDIVPESGLDAWSMIQGEMDRILMYQDKGDVILYKKFREYIDWVWRHDLLKKYL